MALGVGSPAPPPSRRGGAHASRSPAPHSRSPGPSTQANLLRTRGDFNIGSLSFDVALAKPGPCARPLHNRSDETRLGMELRHSKDQLEVADVDHHPRCCTSVAQWNCKQDRQADRGGGEHRFSCSIRPGDRIRAVNGLEGDAIMELLATATDFLSPKALNLTVERECEDILKPVAPSRRAPSLSSNDSTRPPSSVCSARGSLPPLQSRGSSSADGCDTYLLGCKPFGLGTSQSGAPSRPYLLSPPTAGTGYGAGVGSSPRNTPRFGDRTPSVPALRRSAVLPPLMPGSTASNSQVPASGFATPLPAKQRRRSGSCPNAALSARGGYSA